MALTRCLLTIPPKDLDAWNNIIVDVSAYVNCTARAVFKYVNGTSGSLSYLGDIALDELNIGTNVYEFGNSASPVGLGFQTTTTSTSDYDSASWTDIPNSTGSTGGRFNLDFASTASSTTTGPSTDSDGSSTDNYIYFESSSPATYSYECWLRSPVVSFASPYSFLFFDIHRYGDNIGTLEVYLDIATTADSNFYGKYKVALDDGA